MHVQNNILVRTVNTFIKRIPSFKADIRLTTESVMFQEIWKRVSLYANQWILLVQQWFTEYSCFLPLLREVQYLFTEAYSKKIDVKFKNNPCYLKDKTATKNASAVCLFENHRRVRSNCNFINRKQIFKRLKAIPLCRHACPVTKAVWQKNRAETCTRITLHASAFFSFYVFTEITLLVNPKLALPAKK